VFPLAADGRSHDTGAVAVLDSGCPGYPIRAMRDEAKVDFAERKAVDERRRQDEAEAWIRKAPQP